MSAEDKPADTWVSQQYAEICRQLAVPPDETVLHVIRNKLRTCSVQLSTAARVSALAKVLPDTSVKALILRQADLSPVLWGTLLKACGCMGGQLQSMALCHCNLLLEQQSLGQDCARLGVAELGAPTHLTQASIVAFHSCITCRL